MLSSPVVQSVAYAVLTKSIGSGFRVKDDWQAPPEVRNKTIQREMMLLGLVTAFTSGIQALFGKALSPLLTRGKVLGKYTLLLRAAATAPALIVAEITSRKVAPRDLWTQESAAQDVFDRQKQSSPSSLERRSGKMPVLYAGRVFPEERTPVADPSASLPSATMSRQSLPSGNAFGYHASVRGGGNP